MTRFWWIVWPFWFAAVAAIVLQIHRATSERLRPYAYAALAVWFGWVLAVQLQLPVLTLSWSWLLVVGLTALPQWFETQEVLVQRFGPAIERAAGWTDQTRRVSQLAGTWIENRGDLPYGWYYDLVWSADGRTQREMLDLARVLETVEDMPVGSITVLPLSEATRVRVIGLTSDPHQEPIIWDGVPAKSILESKVGGIFANGEPERTVFYTREIGGTLGLDSGERGSGKSQRQKWKICTYGPSDDVRLLLADFKEGVALQRLAPLAERMTTEVEEAVEFLEMAVEIYKANAQHMLEHGWDVYQPDENHPVLWIMTDEDAEFFDEGTPRELQARARIALSQLGRKSRAAGVIKDGATQYPDLAVTATAQYRENLQRRRAYRAAYPGKTDVVLPNAARGVDPANIPERRPGVAYVDDHSLPTRDVMVTPDQERMIVKLFGNRQKRIPAWWLPAFGKADRSPGCEVNTGSSSTGLDARPSVPSISAPRIELRHTPKAGDPDLSRVPVVSMAELIAADAARMTPQERTEEEARRARFLTPETPESEARTKLIDLLREHAAADSEGVTELQAATHCGRTESWTHVELVALCTTKQAEQLEGGRYRGLAVVQLVR